MVLRLASLVILALLSTGAAPSGRAAAQAPIPTVAIEVEGVTVFLAPADADAFQRRLNQPPLLDEPPGAGAPSYRVTTAYWDPAIREDDDEPQVDPVADYFPGGGFVRASREGEDVWIVLDLRQRALLDRYISYYTVHPRPELEPRPGSLKITWATTPDELISIEVGDRRLTEDEAGLFWEAMNPRLHRLVFLDPPRPPDASAALGYWVTFSLPEGRSLRYFVDTAAGSLTDALGTESYDIGDAIGGRIPESAAVSLIEDEDPAGSPLWWFVAVGGGGALLVLALALQRGIEHGRRKTRSL